MAITRDRQRNAVSEGIALGLLLSGRDLIPYDKTDIDLSFEDAFRAWSHKSSFSQVNTDLNNGSDGIWVMMHAEQSRKTWVLYWALEGTNFAIYGRDPDWDPAKPEDVDHAVSMIDGDVPLSGWKELAQEFLSRFRS